MLLLSFFRRLLVCPSRGVMLVEASTVFCVLFVVLRNGSAHPVAPAVRTETVGSLRAVGSGVVLPAAPVAPHGGDIDAHISGVSRQFGCRNPTLPVYIGKDSLPTSKQSTQLHAIPAQGRAAFSSLLKNLEEATVRPVVQQGRTVTPESQDLSSCGLEQRSTDAIIGAQVLKQQCSYPDQHPQRLFTAQPQSSVAQARKTSTKAKERWSRQASPDNNLIIKWNMPCLGSLPVRLKDIQSTLEDVERDEVEIPLFSESSAGASRSSTKYSVKTMQGPLVLRRGVFHRDTLSIQVPYSPSSSELLGRAYALSIVAGSLRARVSYRKSDVPAVVLTTSGTGGNRDSRVAPPDPQNVKSGCDAACRKELEQLFLSRSVETLQATFYPSFGVDVLTFTDLPAIMQNVGARDASALAEYVRASNSGADNKTQPKFAQVGRCIENLSLDGTGALQGKTSRSVLGGLLKDPEYIKQWHHMKRLSNYTLWSDAAWEEIPISAGDAEAEATVVALIDSGCFQHEDYWTSETDNLLWRNRGETDCNDKIDNDGNGYVDDCYGWDFITGTNNVFPDYTSHGTSLASLLVAKHNDGKGGAGVMKFGKVMCLRAATQGTIYLSTLVGAFDYALRNGARISVHAYAFGTAEPHLKGLFESAYKQDHLAVVSAGSQMCDLEASAQCMTYPAGYGIPSILVVGSSNLGGGPCCGTNWGKKAVHVFAAGSRIYAGNCINHKDNEKLNCSNCYAFMYGCSISAGLTAGVAAMVWAYMKKMNPDGWRASKDKESIRIKKALIYSSMPSARVAGACEANGVVNMHRALHYYDKIPAEEFVPHYKDVPSLFRWSFPAFFQGSGATEVTVGSLAAGS